MNNRMNNRTPSVRAIADKLAFIAVLGSGSPSQRRAELAAEARKIMAGLNPATTRAVKQRLQQWLKQFFNPRNHLN